MVLKGSENIVLARQEVPQLLYLLSIVFPWFLEKATNTILDINSTGGKVIRTGLT
jgi:hypothetical protein